VSGVAEHLLAATTGCIVCAFAAGGWSTRPLAQASVATTGSVALGTASMLAFGPAVANLPEVCSNSCATRGEILKVRDRVAHAQDQIRL
jgi:hypothetical protein